MIGEQRHRVRGFTYIGLLIVVAIMGVWLAASATVFHLGVQRDKEKELLYIGHQFRQALERYAKSSVGSTRRLPMRLEDLQLDERFPQKRRYLRRIYRDPMTGNSEWGLVRTADGQIIGVHSLSNDEPLKKDNFDTRDIGFTNKMSYADWVFVAAVARAAPPKASAPVNAPSGAQPLSRG